MTVNRTIHDNSIREALLAGDPAAGDGALTPSEEDAIRARLAVLPGVERSVHVWPWRPVFAGGLVAALLLVLWNRQDYQAPAPPADQPRPARAAERVPPQPAGPQVPMALASAPQPPAPSRAGSGTAALSGKPARSSSPAQAVRMITRGGTRIVWSVNPGARF
jgi:hypothetical protein